MIPNFPILSRASCVSNSFDGVDDGNIASPKLLLFLIVDLLVQVPNVKAHTQK